jgi:adenosine deaminase
MTLLPKAELHSHLEGTITPAWVQLLAKRHHLKIPEGLMRDDDTFIWKDFLDFLKVYDVASSVIQSTEDYRDITYAYLKQSSQEGVIYSELMPSPDHAATSGITYPALIEGVVAGIKDAERDFGIIARIYISCVRHFGVESCEAVAKLAVKYPHPFVVGFGMGGDEAGFPPKQFARAYQIAHEEAGLQCTVHAGEWTGPEQIRDAINYLPVSRLGHGVRIIEDTSLIQEIIDRGITLECCPTSNIALKVFPDYAHHPLRTFYDLGVKLTLGSDDPPYFSTTIGKEYDVAAKHFGFTSAELLQITRNAIQASFADDATKAQLLKKCRLG